MWSPGVNQGSGEYGQNVNTCVMMTYYYEGILFILIKYLYIKCFIALSTFYTRPNCNEFILRASVSASQYVVCHLMMTACGRNAVNHENNKIYETDLCNGYLTTHTGI
jgi:hypothetical protein